MPKTRLPDNLQRRKGEKMPSFVRFLPDHEYIHHLEIPPDFLKYLGNELCGRVTLNLRVSSHRSWNVRVRKLPTGLAFVDGWEDFVRNNFLQGNELLKFNYEGTKHFSIAIFNEDGCARLDCPKIVSDQSPNFAKSAKRPRHRTRIQPVRCCKRLRRMNCCKDDTVMIISSSSESEEPEELNADKDSSDEDQEAPGPESCRSMRRKMKGKVSNKSPGKRKPTFFISLSTTDCTDHLEIPQDFVKYFENGLSARATLKLKDNSARSWHVKVRKTPRGLDFEDGWQEFSKDNSLVGNELLKVIVEGMMHFTIGICNESGHDRFDSTNIRTRHTPNSANNARRPPGRPRIHPVNNCKDDKDDTDAVRILTGSKSNELDELSVEEDSKDGNSEPAHHESSRSMLSNKDKRHGEQVNETENDKEQGSEDGNCDGGEHDSEDGENMDNNDEGRSGNDEQLFNKNLIDEVNELVDEVEEKDKLISELKRALESCQKTEEDLGKARNENSRLLERNTELAKEKELMQHAIEQLRQK